MVRRVKSRVATPSAMRPHPSKTTKGGRAVFVTGSDRGWAGHPVMFRSRAVLLTAL